MSKFQKILAKLVKNFGILRIFAAQKNKNMKHFAFFALLSALFFILPQSVQAQKKKYPVMKFEKTTVDFGTFSQDDAVRTCTFAFSNVGKAPLIINYVHTACGCTVADYPKDPISPGGRGVIKVTYDGSQKMPGRFKKSIQIFTNCKDDLSRLFITGNMTALVKENKKL